MSSERREFFSSSLTIENLIEHSESDDSGLRWAAAIELSQVGSREAIEILWRLTNDIDENVASAARIGLSQQDQTIVREFVNSVDIASTLATSESEDDVVAFKPWKIRPLDIPTSENEWAVDAGILDIIQTEGPILGSRLLKLYGTAVYPDSPKKLSKSRIQRAVQRLEKRNLIYRQILSSEMDQIEVCVFQKRGESPIVIRTQGQRKLGEIPANEVSARLKLEMGYRYSDASKDEKFQHLIKVYDLKPSEYYILGALLSQEWASLLSN